MNSEIIPVKRALISVSNKQGIVEFAKQLIDLGIEIISTGGTGKILRAANILVTDIADITHMPEMMDGRVKTLHPMVHGGILGLRDHHAAVAAKHHIAWIDLVVVNLYPFAETIRQPQSTWDDAIENIDIGGPAMIRSAAKNMRWVGVVVDPADYARVSQELAEHHGLRFNLCKQLALKAFEHTAEYDAMIARYLSASQASLFPSYVQMSFKKMTDLRYGENPHQAAAAYYSEPLSGVLSATQHQGKALSYNNIVDSDAAIACIKEFDQPACVIIKHANPCGVAIAETLETAYDQAFHADAVSAFGGIVMLNRECCQKIAEKIADIFVEVLIAPNYSVAALEILARKPNLRVLAYDLMQPSAEQTRTFIEGGLLLQDKNLGVLSTADGKVVTRLAPTATEKQDLWFAWQVVKHIKSNAILIAKNDVTVGIGAGQVSRIDAVEIALRKAGDRTPQSVLASDAFFPFRDSIDRLADSGIRAIIQPGGSIRDAEVIAACDAHGIAMIFTGQRCFKH